MKTIDRQQAFTYVSGKPELQIPKRRHRLDTETTTDIMLYRRYQIVIQSHRIPSSASSTSSPPCRAEQARQID